MAVYAYKALDTQHNSTRGIVTADSSLQARQQLRSQGFLVEEIKVESTKTKTRSFWFRRKGLTNQVANALRELSTLISVGVNLAEALGILAKQQQGAFKTSLLTLKDDVAGGKSLADAMKNQSDVYDELIQHMVRVGETAGNLDVVLDQIAEFKERSLQLKDRIVGAVTYPAIVLFTSMIVVVFLMTVVVPMLLSSLLEAGQELPWPTRVLKGASDLLVGHGVALVVGGTVAVLAISVFLRSTRGQVIRDRVLLKVPLLGSMIHRQAISRIAMVISTLLKSGIEYVDATRIAIGSTKNRVMQMGLEESVSQVEQGQEIGASLERAGVFPPVVVHVFSLGQASGKLEEMLDRLAETYDRQVASLASRLTAAIEPILIIVLAIFVGFILFATLLPILEAGNVLQS